MNQERKKERKKKKIEFATPFTCWRVCTMHMRDSRISRTISRILRLGMLACTRVIRRSIAMKVPVRPMPALIWKN